MKEGQPIKYQHLEALHTLISIPFKKDLGIRASKEQILEKLGFSKGTNIAIKKEFTLPENDAEAHCIREYVVQQLNEGRFLSMLFKDGNWETMGGAPVTYIMSEEELNDKLIFDHERLVEARAHNGVTISIDHRINLQTYSRRRSMLSELSGFTNCDGSVPVRLGGGFRLQVDNLSFINGQPYMTLSGCFSFNDMGSRVLALSCREDCLVPRYEISFLLKVGNGQLIFLDSRSGDDETLISTNEVELVVNKVLFSLFKKDDKAIGDLLRGLMSVRPSMKVHQLEGIFSIPSETEISAEVIDFDGIDSFDIGGQELSLSPAERLVQGQLRSVGYLLTNPDDLLSYISFKNQIQDIVGGLIDSTNVAGDIKMEISRHFPNSSGVFSRKQTGAVKLGRLLKSLDIDWSDTENPHIRLFKNSDSEITAIYIAGYDLAFWRKASILVDCTDIRTVSLELSRITRREILPAHLSSLREGD